ncbi:acetoacetate--CoA ligase [Rhodococcus sp. OK302]|uniref:acetoacetate--CoA ligase n=1 Tax=Rhodococcus sp. OK302 TaxID=1882769 RepID=UPI000B94025B|nr:acetoacetate--CoA ligase [Rhodococcus sp. OK302]OYD70996.1 acetoacetyl-CoA synthetase [Rhodococcus sp. OK302]
MPADSVTADGALWAPSAEFAAQSVLTDYLSWLQRERQLDFTDYRQLWEWSTTDLSAFWLSIRDYFNLDIDDPQQVLDESAGMPHVRWFIGSTTNYAANALVHEQESGLALQSLNESGVLTTMTWRELRLAVGGLATWFRAQGIVPGDRIVAYVPNIAGAVIAMLASAAVGAVWASCAQEYSAQGAHDRFAQLEPKILIAADGYHHGGKIFDRRQSVTELAGSLSTVESVVWIDNLGLLDETTRGERFTDLTENGCEPEFTRVPFDHPLWVLFSSGTTGPPKGIVHGHGGILLEHSKFCGLNTDLVPGDRFLWLATPSWMVWNIQISGLLVGATISTYDGAPSWPDAAQIWRIAERLGLDVLGVSAASLVAAHKGDMHPLDVAPNLTLSAIGSTGSPLPPDTATWVYQRLPQVWLASASGGTDICSSFAGGVPTEPVFADQIQGPALGVRLDAWNEHAQSVIGETGEMVVTRPMPSMPIRFWNDTDFAKYTSAYFDHYPGVWRHGDWITITERGGVVIHGRSDATMNRHGVRIGSGEIYQVVDQLQEVADSVVVGVELADGGYWMPLFVVPARPPVDTRRLTQLIRNEIRTNASPRHVPDEIILVDSLPHTRTGKKLEVPIKRILQGADPVAVLNPQAVDNADALYQFIAFRPLDKTRTDPPIAARK